MDWKLTTDDRVVQVDWLREFAANISEMGGDESSADEIVEFALSEDGLESWNITMPTWFDRHDRRLLIEMVEANIEEDTE